MEDKTGVKLASSLQTLLKGEVSLTAALLQLIKALEAARGNGTSMISLIMPPKDQVWQAIFVQWWAAQHKRIWKIQVASTGGQGAEDAWR